MIWTIYDSLYDRDHINSQLEKVFILIVLILLSLISILHCIQRSRLEKELERQRLEELKYPDHRIPPSFLQTVSAVTVPSEKKSQSPKPIEYSVYRILEEASRTSKNASRAPSQGPPTRTPTSIRTPTSVPVDVASTPSVL